jgi:hypothetical protein
LQAALDTLAAANNRSQNARDKIMAHCEAAYGFVRGDVDNDTFIETCDGGRGASAGMSAVDFESSMLADIRQHSKS